MRSFGFRAIDLTKTFQPTWTYSCAACKSQSILGLVLGIMAALRVSPPSVCLSLGASKILCLVTFHIQELCIDSGSPEGTWDSGVVRTRTIIHMATLRVVEKCVCICILMKKN